MAEYIDFDPLNGVWSAINCVSICLAQSHHIFLRWAHFWTTTPFALLHPWCAWATLFAVLTLAFVASTYADESGVHGLSCRLSSGRRSRHATINKILHRALVSAGVPSVWEPCGTSRDDGKRTDGMSLIPWAKSRLLYYSRVKNFLFEFNSGND
jgi:hypothetical protein